MASASRVSTPLPPIHGSRGGSASGSRTLSASRESKKSHRKLTNQYAAQSPVLSIESRMARQEQLNALRFNASDNMFVPGGRGK